MHDEKTSAISSSLLSSHGGNSSGTIGMGGISSNCSAAPATVAGAPTD